MSKKKKYFPTRQNCMTEQDNGRHRSLCNFLSVNVAGVNASYPPNWDGQSGLFDESEPEVSDTVAEITGTQHVQSKIKAFTVN